MKKALLIVTVILTTLSIMFASSPAIAQADSPNKVAEVSIQPSSITWTPIPSNLKGMTLTITGPNNFYFQKQYDNGNAQPTLSNKNFGNGAYMYEIVLWPNISPSEKTDPSLRGINPQPQSDMKQSGAFTVAGGSFVVPTLEAASQNQAAPKKTPAKTGVTPFDVVNADDFIVQGSICAGFDCVDNESFGFDTIRLKENNLRIGFTDTSVGAFPSNDWTIVANDSASGGASFLGFEDVTGARFPFKVTAGAPNNALFVSNTGNIGLGTGTPVLDVHMNTSDTPAIRFEQNNAGGFTAQTWDVAGNEANFFVRDVTGGSRLPFRIRPGAPTSAIDVAANGNVGIGTASPTFDLDVANTGAATLLAVRRTDGSTLRLAAGVGLATIGTTDNAPLGFLINGAQKMTLATDSSLTVLGPVNATVFNPTSDKNAKENFGPVDQKSILQRLSTIPISTWNFIENDNKTKHMGPMAQDFYAAFGLGADNKHISTVDADGVAFAAIQELNKRNESLSSENSALRNKVDDLSSRVSALEAGSTTSAQSLQNIIIILLVGINLGLAALVIWFIKRGSFVGATISNK